MKIEGGTLLIGLNEPIFNQKKTQKIIDTYEFEFLEHSKLMDKIDKNLGSFQWIKDVLVIRDYAKAMCLRLFVNKLAEMYIKDYIESNLGR
jgi:hypothetical protein